MKAPTVEKGIIASRLITARNTLGLTINEVSGACEISVAGISKMESGEWVPGSFELRRFARLYRWNVAWLLGEETEETVDPQLSEATKYMSTGDKEKVLEFAKILAANPSPRT